MLDIEAALPFQFIAVVLAYVGVSRDWKGVVFFAGATALLALPMFLVRAFDPGRREVGVRYFFLNELYVLVFALLVLSVRLWIWGPRLVGS
ncbi:MAG TPA: hypothetical protein VEY88_17100 [Archangium sp.]|nr:hypothetical protein [Archangium sp.]